MDVLSYIPPLESDIKGAVKLTSSVFKKKLKVDIKDSIFGNSRLPNSEQTPQNCASPS